MLTTAEPFLKALSEALNETATDTSSRRIGFFNRAVQHYLDEYKWSWAKKKGTITLAADTLDYDLTTLFTDYNVSWGIDIPEASQKILGSVDYVNRSDFSSNYYTLSPDNKYFILTIDSPTAGTTIDVWYYRNHTFVNASNATLEIPLPNSALEPIVLYMKYMVHDAKRQRYDARNAILDYKEKLDQARPQEASNKALNKPRVIPNMLTYLNFRRRY